MPAWTFWRKENSPAYAGNRITIRRSSRQKNYLDIEVFTALLLGLLATEDDVTTILPNIANYLPDNRMRLETSVITALLSSFCFHCTGPILKMLRYFVSDVNSRAPKL